MYKSNAFKFSKYITKLCRIGFQKFSTCRNIEEKILNREVTPFRTGHRFLAFDFRTCNNQFRSEFFSLKAGFKFYLCYSRDRCQRLTTKSHCTQSKKIRCFTNFGRSMTFERQTGIRFRHPLPIVNNLYTGLACISH